MYVQPCRYQIENSIYTSTSTYSTFSFEEIISLAMRIAYIQIKLKTRELILLFKFKKLYQNVTQSTLLAYQKAFVLAKRRFRF